MLNASTWATRIDNVLYYAFPAAATKRVNMRMSLGCFQQDIHSANSTNTFDRFIHSHSKTILTPKINEKTFRVSVTPVGLVQKAADTGGIELIIFSRSRLDSL